MTLTIRSMLLMLCLCTAVPAAAVFAGGEMPQPQGQPHHAAYMINGIKTYPLTDGFVVRITGNSEPAYTKFELVDPLRIVLDIADATLGSEVKLPLVPFEGPVSKIDSAPQEGAKSMVRLELFMSKDPGYEVARQDNDIVVTFGKSSRPAPAEKSIATTETEIQLSSIDIDKSDSQTVVHLRAPSSLTNYKYAELPASKNAPARLYIDLKNVKSDNIKSTIPVKGSLAQIRTAHRKGTLRVVFDAAGNNLFPYEINSTPDGMQVVIGGKAPADAVAAIIQQDQEPQKTLTESKKIKSTQSTATSGSKGESESFPDTFSVAGYNKQRITVDFYKIDLHNVFRLVGEISGKNIVVDEAVAGSLTLALKDVPWDFALDIILNLKDLQKEERYNTIVISPKSKEFVWPEKAVDTLAIKADPLTINKRIEDPAEVFAAKQLVSEARRLEEGEKYEEALNKYKEAFENWPDNSQIPSRMAALYLVQLKLYPQAVHFAKEALRINASDPNAALLAAVALATMKKDAEAKQYFDLAVSDSRPTSDALLSYAAFLEDGMNYPAAIAMLERHKDLYGDNLETFISKARLYDKNGEPAKAVEEYRAALLSGYRLPQDLQRYIDGRIAMDSQQ